MSVRVLVCCFEIPTQGGAATSAYALFAKMKREGVDAHYVNIVERATVPYFQWTHGASFGNPAGLPDVHTCIVEWPFSGSQPALRATIARVAPQVVVARGYIATLFAKQAAPELPVVFSTAGSRQAEFLIAQGRAAQAVDLPALLPRTGRLPTPAPGNEGAAFDAADVIVPNSDWVGDTIRAFFSVDRSCKVHAEAVWSAEWVVEAVAASGVRSEPFERRAIDVLFCATSWGRGEKNLPALQRLVPRLTGLRVVIVGDCPQRIAGAEHRGYVDDRTAMFALLADTKVVAAVSLVDACPTTLFEAAFLGCNIVATKNCGNWRVCHETLLVDPPDETAFATTIRRGVERQQPNGLDWFLRTRSYARLLEILAALAE
ncbi:MAG: glycosyltransferase [Candidatus Binatia bacterium]